MTLKDPLWMQNLEYTAAEDRTLIGALFSEGVVGPNDLVVGPRAAGANMSVDVSIGSAVILGDDGPDQGSYLVQNTAIVNRSVGAAPSAGLTRIDLVVATIRDAAVIGGVNNDWVVTVIAGTASATPVAPAVPASSIALATVTVPNGLASVTSGQIVDKRKLGRAAGGTPSGSMVDWPGATLPAGWAWADGSALSRTFYADLYAALGGASSPWGQGDGTTTFNVPDKRGRVSVGQHVSQTPFAVVAQVGGSRNAPLPSHNHGGSGSGGSHDHTTPDGDVFAYSTGNVENHRIPEDQSTTDGAYVTFTGVDDAGDHSHTIAAEGVAATDANMQPYVVIPAIIRL